MVVRYDKLNRYEQPTIHLCNPGSIYNDGNLTNSIGALSYVTDLEVVFNFNEMSEANFRIHLAPQDTNEKTEAISNMYKMVQNRRLLFLEDIGYFVITSVKEDIGDSGRYKDVTANSIEEEINNTGVPYIDGGTYRFYVSPNSTTEDRFTIDVDAQKFHDHFVYGGVYNLVYYSSMGKWRALRKIASTDVMTAEYIDLEECGITATIIDGGFLNGDSITVTLYAQGSEDPRVEYYTSEMGLINMIVQKLPYWTLDEEDIDPDVKDMFRTFEEVDPDAKCFEFMINDMQEAYECIFLFDCIHRTIKVKHKDNYIVPTDIHLSNDDFISLQTIEENAEDVCTALHIRDSGDTVTVGAVNPTGGNTIYDFSYYLDWMSDHLRPAAVKWMNTYNTALEGYYEDSLEFWRANNIRMAATLDNERLQALVDMYQKCLENLGAVNDIVEVTGSYNKAIKGYTVSDKRTLEYQRYSAVVINSIFREAVSGVSGVYKFVFHSSDSSWYLVKPDDTEEEVSLSEYGISVTVTGTGLEDGDDITVTFTRGTNADPIDIDGQTVQSIKVELQARIDDCNAAIQRNEIIKRDSDDTAHFYEEHMKSSNANLEFAVTERGIFDEEQLAEIQQYIYEGIYTDDNVTFTESMSVEEQFEQMSAIFNRAMDTMKNVSRPLQSFSIDSENFVFIKDFSHWTDQLETGCIINIETDEYQRYSAHITNDDKFADYVDEVPGVYTYMYNASDDTWRDINDSMRLVRLNVAGILISVLDAGLVDRDKIKITLNRSGAEGDYTYSTSVEVVPVGYNNISRLFLSSMTLNYEDATLSMQFGNRMRRVDTRSLYDDALGSISSSANSIDYIKETIAPIYDAKDSNGETYYSKTAKSIQSMRDLAMDKALESSNQEVVIDGSGITVRKLDYEGQVPTGDFNPHQLKITSNMIAMTDNGWESAKTAIGELDVDGKTLYGVNAEVLIGDVIIGNELHIVDDSGNDMFEVTNDKISAVVAAADETGERVSKITQTVNGIDVKVSAIQENGVDKVATTARYTFDNNGLNISRENGSIENKITEDGMYVSQVIGSNKEDVLVANNDGVNAINLTARKYLHIGKYSIFKDFERGTDTKRTACFFSEEFIEE